MKVRLAHQNIGFTIVELAVVIFVLSILTALTLVVYPGIQKRAGDTEVQGDLRQAAMKLEAEKANTGGYPDAQAKVDGGKGLPKSSADRTYVYTSTIGAYCVSATSERSGKSFRITSESSEVVEGECTVIPVAPIADGDPIQTVTNANCPSTRVRVVDARDNHTYWVQKMPDNRCWMLTNLAYAGGGTNTYGDVKTIQNGTGDSSGTYTAARYYVPPGANVTAEPTNPSVSTDGTGQYGFLYNWCAAMGAQTSTGACGAASTPVPNNNTSVCPAGWRLPRGNGGEMGVFLTALGSPVNDATVRTAWLSQRAGLWSGGSVGQQGVSGHYWSSDQYMGQAVNYASGMYLNNSNASGNSFNQKDNGAAIRCIIN